MRPTLFALALGLLGAAGCAARGAPAQERSDGRVITAEQIARWNALDAFEVIERVGGYSLAETRNGGVAIRQRRGRSSITNSSADHPLLLLDNTLLSNASVLRQVRASQIDRVELLSAGAATARYGTGAAAGAILIFTRAR